MLGPICHGPICGDPICRGNKKNWPQKVKGPICRVIDRPVPEPLACSLTNDVDDIIDIIDVVDVVDVVDVADKGCEII